MGFGNRMFPLQGGWLCSGDILSLGVYGFFVGEARLAVVVGRWSWGAETECFRYGEAGFVAATFCRWVY